MFPINYLKAKKSKKGMTLVEVVCSVIVLSIVFVGVLNAVAFSRQMVFSNNSREKASFKGQLVADEIFSIATGYNPDTQVDELKTKLSDALMADDDPQNSTEGNDFGKAKLVGTLTDPSAFVLGEDKSYIEYTVEAIGKSASKNNKDTDSDSTPYVDSVEIGWNITVRVFYQEIGGHSGYRCVDIPVFAPLNYIKDA